MYPKIVFCFSNFLTRLIIVFGSTFNLFAISIKGFLAFFDKAESISKSILSNFVFESIFESKEKISLEFIKYFFGNSLYFIIGQINLSLIFFLNFFEKLKKKL